MLNAIICSRFLLDLAPVFEVLSDPVVVCDREGMVVSGNSAASGFLGFNPVGMTWLTLAERMCLRHSGEQETGEGGFSPDFLSGDGGSIKKSPCRLKAADGETVSALFSFAPLQRNGDICGVVYTWAGWDSCREQCASLSKKNLLHKVEEIDLVLGEKIKALDEKKSQLQRQSEIVDKLFANTQFLIALLDTDLDFIRVNKAYALSDGRGEDFFIGKNHFELYPHPENERIFKEVLASGEPYIAYAKPFAYPEKQDEGGTYWDWSINPIKDEKGEISGLILLLLDATARKKIDTELGEAKRLSDIGALATTIAHELRSPLGVILGTVYNIKKKYTDTKLLKNMERIERKIDESERIINNLLNYSRIKQPERKRIHFFNFVNECVNDIERQYMNPEIKLIRDFDAFKDLTLMIDPFQLREVFLNILTNAYQSYPERRGNIELSGRLEPGWVFLAVRDYGEGIEKEDLPEIFEPFFTRKSKGTGLGLTICRELVHLHKGSLRLESTKGEGTVVRIRIPLLPAEE